MASIINSCLPKLQRFIFHWHLSNDENFTENIAKKIPTEIRNYFIDTYNDQYKAQFKVDRDLF